MNKQMDIGDKSRRFSLNLELTHIKLIPYFERYESEGEYFLDDFLTYTKVKSKKKPTVKIRDCTFDWLIFRVVYRSRERIA